MKLSSLLAVHLSPGSKVTQKEKHLGDNYLLSLFNSTSMKQKWIFMLFVTCSFYLYTFCLIFCLVTLLNTVLNEFALFRKLESHKILIATRFTRFTRFTSPHHQVFCTIAFYSQKCFKGINLHSCFSQYMSNPNTIIVIVTVLEKSNIGILKIL
jgi:hypothetical protein